MAKKKKNRVYSVENISIRLTKFVGTPFSVVLHTFFFIIIFSLKFFGFGVDEILLILTTVVSLEAIYLSIFIQMTVNRNTAALEAARDDIEDIVEDVEDISEEIEDISEDIEGIQKKSRVYKIKAAANGKAGQILRKN